MQLIGLARLGRDAEIRFTNDGEPVASLSLAFEHGRKGQDGRRPTQWVEATLWGKRAESLAPYLLKGGAVVVTLDDPHIEEFQKRDGSTGNKLVGKVTALELAGKPAQAEEAPPARPAPAPAPRAAAPRPAPRPPAPAPAARNGYADAKSGRAAPPPSTGTGFDDMTDDIPF